jgi:uncharacterized protein YjbJ (UPF0337 family)
MGERTDQAKGRVKQAAGDLTDDERLRREGKTDELSGKVKGIVEDIKDKTNDLVDDVKDKISKHR